LDRVLCSFEQCELWSLSRVGVSTNVVLNKEYTSKERATGNFCDEKKGVDLAGLLENERRKSSKFVFPHFISVAVNGLKVSVIVWATNSSAIDSFVSAEAGLLSIFLKKKIDSLICSIHCERVGHTRIAIGGGKLSPSNCPFCFKYVLYLYWINRVLLNQV